MSEPADEQMPRTRPNRPRTVEALLLFGYVLVLVAATFTVVVPELSKEPEASPSAEALVHPPAG